MGTAFAFHPKDRDIVADRMPIQEVNDAAAIIAMNRHTFGTTDRTGFQLWSKKFHERAKNKI